MANGIPRILIGPNSTPLKMRGTNTNVYVQNYYGGSCYNIGDYLGNYSSYNPVSMNSMYYNNYSGGGFWNWNNFIPDWLMKAGERSTLFSMISGLFSGKNTPET